MNYGMSELASRWTSIKKKNPLVLYGTLIVTNREMRHRASSSKHLHVTYCTKETLDMHDHINKEPLKYPYITAHKRQDTFPNLEHPLLLNMKLIFIFCFSAFSCHLHTHNTQKLDKLNRLAQIKVDLLKNRGLMHFQWNVPH